MITRKDFARQVSAKTGFTIKDIETVMAAQREAIVEGVRNKETVKAFDGIWFQGVDVPARTVKAPSTGEMVDVPAKIKARAKFGTSFKADINE